MKRRHFVTGVMAASIPALGSPAGAHDQRIPRYTLPEEFLPRVVRIKASFQPNEIHVDPGQFALYWTMPDRKAIRYTVGIGRPGLYEAGEFFVGAKKEWPSWTPTPEMIEREPELYAEFSEGMPGGIRNPLGARALYLFTPSRGDTFLRIHGTNDPSSLARRVSNGCARLVNDHAIDLYNRVPLQSRVVLYPMA